MGVSYPCGEFWLDVDITSYATDAEARDVWNTFIGDASVQKILANDFGSLLDSGPDWFLVMGGTYLYPETYDYGFLNLYALYQGCIIGIKRTRISAAFHHTSAVHGPGLLEWGLCLRKRPHRQKMRRPGGKPPAPDTHRTHGLRAIRLPVFSPEHQFLLDCLP